MYAEIMKTVSFNTMPFVFGLSVLATIVAVVILFMFVVPEKKRAGLPKIGQILHDIFNFKSLFIEYILKATYVILTVFCVVYGVLMLFGISHFSSDYFAYTHWYGGYGILLAIAGPIAIRITYELFMMFVLLVKNVIEINKKMKNSDDENK